MHRTPLSSSLAPSASSPSSSLAPSSRAALHAVGVESAVNIAQRRPHAQLLPSVDLTSPHLHVGVGRLQLRRRHLTHATAHPLVRTSSTRCQDHLHTLAAVVREAIARRQRPNSCPPCNKPACTLPTRSHQH
eukprot:2541621-Rhodomonas_salina.1